MIADDMLPQPERKGLVVMEPGKPFTHYCRVCGAWGAWGYDVDILKGRPGVRLPINVPCFAHKHVVRRERQKLALFA